MYKNARKYPSSPSLFRKLQLLEVNLCMICYDHVEAEVLAELGENTVDSEMAFLLRETGASLPAGDPEVPLISECDENGAKEDSKALECKETEVAGPSNAQITLEAPWTGEKSKCSPSANNGNKVAENNADACGPETSAVQTVKCKGNSGAEGNDKQAGAVIVGCAAPAKAEDAETAENDPYFYVNNLDALLAPLIGVCNKRIASMIFYVYKSTGVNHFNFLFEKLGNSLEHLIELHLLVARSAKSRAFNLSDIKESLGKDSFKAVGEADFFSENIENAVTENSMNKIELGYFSDDGSDAGSCSAGFLVESLYANPLIHLDQAKKHLFSIQQENQPFFIENASTYLSLKFDRALYLAFVKCHKSPYFCPTLSKFQDPPFFLFRGAAIASLLKESSQRKCSTSKPFLDFLDGWGDAGAGIARSLYKHRIVCNCYTLKYFLEFSIATFDGLCSPIDNYTLISGSLSLFVRKYRHPALFRVLHGLISCRMERVCQKIREDILEDIDLYMGVFYRGPAGTAEAPDEKLRGSGWALRGNLAIGSAMIDSSEEGPFLDKEQALDDAKGTELVAQHRKSAEPSVDDGDDKLVAAFINPAIHDAYQQRIVAFLLNSFHKQCDAKAVLDSFLVSAAADPELKMHLIKGIEVLHMLGPDAQKQAVQRLQDTEDASWRYRALLIRERHRLAEFGVSAEWFTTNFANDKVFLIRKMIKEIDGEKYK